MMHGLTTLLSIRATGGSDAGGAETISAAHVVGRTLAYVAVIGAGSLIGAIAGIIIALFTGVMQVC